MKNTRYISLQRKTLKNTEKFLGMVWGGGHLFADFHFLLGVLEPNPPKREG